MNSPDRPMNPPTGVAFRYVTLLFAALLAAQSVWLLLAELTRPRIDRLPPDAASAAVAAKQRGSATWAALFGVIRGDLWADSAYTYADLLWGDNSSSAGIAPALESVRAKLERALGDAPHQSGAWLLLAGLAARYPSLNFNATQALKTSYYTGPSEQDLMVPRLRIAAQSNFLNDAEIREFASRDLRLLLARHQKSVIDEVYNGGSPTAQAFIKQAIGRMPAPAPAPEAPHATPH
jgi:hypothetical protein